MGEVKKKYDIGGAGGGGGGVGGGVFLTFYVPMAYKKHIFIVKVYQCYFLLNVGKNRLCPTVQ